MRFIKSVGYAIRGLVTLVRHERNFQIQSVIALLVVIAAAWLRFKTGDWVKILLCIGLVMSLEAVNSAIERTLNKISIEYDAETGRIKDMAAGAVLLAAMISVAVGILVFLKYL